MAMNEAQLNRALVELAAAHAENRVLRRKVKERSRDGKILRRAEVDAKALLAWHYSGLSTSRADCAERGMSQRRWEWARALLDAARLLKNGTIIDVPVETAKDRLEVTANRIVYEHGMGRVRMRLPKGR